MNILHDLNEKQIQAVIHKDGPMLVIAGPGTGKTKVITHRIAYLIRQHGIKPESILAITFTNKAAQEMRDRVNNEIGEPHGSNIKVSTFHAFCVKVLREHAHHIGLSENFAIFDQEIQDEVLLEVVNELNLNSYNYPPWQLRNIISDAKCNDVSDGLFIDPDIVAEIDDPDAEANIQNAVKTYQHKLDEYNALDFDDLLIKTVALFEKAPEVQQEYHQTISHILVDEYHDVNSVQYRLLQLLCTVPEYNLMVVADADQSIYSWRGSNPQYIEDFKSNFTPQTVELDDHYRCSETILHAAQEVIAQNPLRQQQHTLITHKDEGRNIYHYTFSTPTEEARSIIKIIRNLVKQRNFSYRDIAVFYRTHKLADVLEEELLRTGIEFQRIRATNSFDDDNLKGILSYLCFTQWQLPRDFENAINFPEKRIDDLTWVRLKWLAQRKDLTLAELLKSIEEYPEDVGPLTRRNIRRFWEQLQSLADDIEDEEIDKIVQKLFARLELFRSPCRTKELSVIEEQPEMQNLALAQDVLYSALDRGEPIQITASYGIDTYCAAEIIHQTLKTYLNKNVRIQFLPKKLNVEEQNSQSTTVGVSGSELILNGNAVNLLIGDFTDLGEKGTAARTILMGTTTSKETGAIQIQSEGVRSIAALKLCQRLLSRFETPNMADMVIYDLETTGINPKRADIVEIAAKRLNVIGNEIESFERLVKPPGGHIPLAVTRIHGISTEDVKDAPSIEIVLPEFCSFIQDRILIGHNVARYDNPILERDLQTYLKRNLPNPYYDTLVTARKLLPRQRRGIDALAEKFGIEHGRLHRAMEDVETNRQIFKELIQIDLQKREVKSLTEFLPLVGVGILSKAGVPEDHNDLNEVSAFLNVAKRFVKVHHSTLPDDLPLDSTEKEQAAEFINQLAQSDLPIFREDTEWIEAKAKFRNLLLKFNKIGDGKSLSDFLDYQKLLTNFDEIDDKIEQVTLMTLHAAKGTEFPVVVIIGMEEGSFPMWKRNMTPEEIEEERRLFYVGMTRAQDQLYLSSTIYRYGDRERSASMFIYEMPADYMIKWSPHSGT